LVVDGLWAGGLNQKSGFKSKNLNPKVYLNLGRERARRDLNP
jgi:hypothetical protein